MKIISEKEDNFENKFKNFVNGRSIKISEEIDLKVKRIFHQVKKNGDKALLNLTYKYDKNKIKINEILINKKTINHCAKKVSPEFFKSFKM